MIFSHIDEVCHIVTTDELRSYTASGIIHPESLDSEGFVHCSTSEQVAATLGRYYANRDDITVLTLRVADIGPEVRWEESHPGEWFPHVYGPITMTAVVAQAQRPAPLG